MRGRGGGAIRGHLASRGGVHYLPTTDPAVIDWLTVDASAVAVSKKLGASVTLAGATPPAYDATGLNGLPAIKCVAGCAKFAIGASISGKTKLGVVVSATDQLNNASSTGIIFESAQTNGTGDATGSSFAFLRIDTGDISTEMWGGSNVQAEYFATASTATKTLATPKVVTIQGDATLASNNAGPIRLNGVQQSGSRAFTQAFSAGHFGNFVFSIGARASTAIPYVGWIRDIIIFDATLANVSQIEAFVNQRAGGLY